MTATVSTRRTSDLQPVELDEIRRLCIAAFAGDFADDDWRHTLGGHHTIAVVGGRIVAHAAVVERTLLAGPTPLRTGYVEAVATAPGHQRTGLGTAVMGAVGQVIRRGFELGALSTPEPAFYRRLGWATWLGPTYVDTAHGRRRTEDEDGGVMVLRFGRQRALDLTLPLTCQERPGDDW